MTRDGIWDLVDYECRHHGLGTQEQAQVEDSIAGWVQDLCDDELPSSHDIRTHIVDMIISMADNDVPEPKRCAVVDGVRILDID